MVPYMLETIQALSLLTFMEIIGPILLGVGLIYGIVQFRRRSPAEKTRGRRKRLDEQTWKGPAHGMIVEAGEVLKDCTCVAAHSGRRDALRKFD
jgi:hypothetical protein